MSLRLLIFQAKREEELEYCDWLEAVAPQLIIMSAWNETMDNSLRESVLRNYFNFTLIALELSTSRHSISADACRKRWTYLHKQRLVIPPKPPRKHVLDISDVDFSKQTSPSIFGGLTTPSSFNIFRDSLKDTFQKMDEKVAELLPEMPDIDADDQESDEETVPLEQVVVISSFRTAMIDNKVVIQAKPLSFKTDQEIMQEELAMPTALEVGKSGALQPQNYEAFLNTIKHTSFLEDDASVTVIQPEVDLEKELMMIDLPCNLNPSLNNDLKAPKAKANPKPLILRRNSEDMSPQSASPVKKESNNSMSLDSILAAQGTTIEALLEGEDDLDLDLSDSSSLLKGDEHEDKKAQEQEKKEKVQENQEKQERKREGGRNVKKTIERMRKRSHSRSKTPPRQNGQSTSKQEKERNYYKTARLRATVAEESDDEDDKFFLQSRKSTRDSLQLPQQKVWRDWESMGTYDSIYGENNEEKKEEKQKQAQRMELEAERDDFLATFIVPGQKRPGKPGGGRKVNKEKKKVNSEQRNVPEWEEKARLRREQLRAANKEAKQQLVFRHETRPDEESEEHQPNGEIVQQISGAIDEWRNAF